MNARVIWLDNPLGGSEHRLKDPTRSATWAAQGAAAYSGMSHVDSARLHSLVETSRMLRKVNGGRTDGFVRRSLAQLGMPKGAMPPELRADADAGGLFLPRQLTHVFEPIDDLRAPLTITEAFAKVRGVPPGAEFFSQPRLGISGEAMIWSGGPVPRVQIAQSEQPQPVITIASSYDWTTITELNASFASFDLVSRKRAAAYRIVDEKRNELGLFGADSANVWGVLNHPDLPRVYSAVPMGPAAATTPDAVVVELCRLARIPYVASKTAMSPNQMLISPGLATHLAAARRTSNSDQTVAEAFFATEKNASRTPIQKFTPAPEMDDLVQRETGGQNYWAILFYNDAPDSMGLVEPMEPVETPPQVIGMETVVYVYSRWGGLKISFAGNNLLVLIPKS